MRDFPSDFFAEVFTWCSVPYDRALIVRFICRSLLHNAACVASAMDYLGLSQVPACVIS